MFCRPKWTHVRDRLLSTQFYFSFSHYTSYSRDECQGFEVRCITWLIRIKVWTPSSEYYGNNSGNNEILVGFALKMTLNEATMKYD